MFPPAPQTPGLRRFACAALRYIATTGQVPTPTYFNNVLRNSYGTTLGGEETKLRAQILQLTGFVKDGARWTPAEHEPAEREPGAAVKEMAAYVAQQWEIDLR